MKRKRLGLFDASRKASILANLFPAAHDTIERGKPSWRSATGER